MISFWLKKEVEFEQLTIKLYVSYIEIITKMQNNQFGTFLHLK